MYFKKIKVLAGDIELKKRISRPFNLLSIEFLDLLSKEIFKNGNISKYPDLATFAFWSRKRNILSISKKYSKNEIRFGIGLIYHIAPSNMPVNFIYSFAFGIISGNSNVIKVSEKNFDQVNIFINCFNKISKKKKFKDIHKSNVFIRYKKEDELITRYYSSICDARIVWGGDETVKKINKIEIPPKSKSINFPDRYSFCILNSNKIKNLDLQSLKQLAKNFYNDTYLIDQNACTSPHLIIWVGNIKEKDKKLFWNSVEHEVKKKYNFENIFSLNKYNKLLNDILDNKFLTNITKHGNIIYRILINKIDKNFDTKKFKGQWGYFYEYNVKNINEISKLVSPKFQTLSYYGFTKKELNTLFEKNNFDGIDRVVPVGRTLDMGLIWDGYDLPITLSRLMEIK